MTWRKEASAKNFDAGGPQSERLPIEALARGTNAQDCAEGQAWARRYLKVLIIAFVLHIISAAMFIGFVNRPVFDDKYNLIDVQTYAHKGLSVATVLSHRNPPGPTSFLWMAAGVRLLGGGELRDARIAALLSWVLLFLGILFGARYSRFPQVWYGALLAALIFPHSVMAAATTLTEGPALLFAMLGVLLWIESLSRPAVSASSLLLLIVGGLSMGAAVSCRQYYLALFPAAVLFGLFHSRALPPKEKNARLLGIILSLVVASLPVILLIFVWRGLTSPGTASGMSHPELGWKAYAGLNVSRPLVAAFYSCLYLLPLTLPVVWHIRPRARWLMVLASTIAGIVVASFASSLLQRGPLGALIWMASPRPAAQFILFGCIATLTVYNAAQMALLIWEKRQFLLSCPPLTFALLAVLFFIVEQFGVGGNVEFYDRYVLQIAPFLGVIAFSLTPRLGLTRLLILAAMDVFAHVMLWSHAFSG